MRIAISTPTGQIGNKITRQLLEWGKHELVLLARNPASLDEEKSMGADVVKADLRNRESLVEPLRAADVFFFLIPPFNTGGEEREIYRQVVANVKHVIEQSGLSRMVLLSSLGAHHPEGTGAILGLHDAEQELRKLDMDIAFLRVGYLMENYFWVIDSILAKSAIELPISGETEMSFLATRDVATKAVELLDDTSWKGIQVKELVGCIMTFDEVASSISSACGRGVKHVKLTAEEVRQQVERGELGFHVDYLPEYMEVFECMEKGMTVPEFLQEAEMVILTTMDDFAREELVPLFNSAIKH